MESSSQQGMQQPEGWRETRATGGFDPRDQLTGVRGYYTLLNDAAHYFGKDVYVVLCDLDNFRMVNDAYGENCGNVLLQKVGHALQLLFGDEHVFRFGSDEFLVVNEFMDEDALLEKFHVLDRRVDAIGCDDAAAAHLSLSYGYVHGAINTAEALHEAIRYADRKMYEAKRLGKARAMGAPLSADPLLSDGVRARKKLYKSYEMDELTGMANLMYFRNQLAAMVKGPGSAIPDASVEVARNVTVVYFDIENFKAYNQKFGFAAADELLLLVADAIQDAFPGCVAARASADQFVVAGRDFDPELAIAQVRAAFRRRHKDSSIMLKAGVYLTGQDADIDDGEEVDVGLICDRAKMACDDVKGRRDVFFRYYDADLQRNILLRRYVLDNFDRAIADGWIRVFYQPIVRTATGEICEEECLARWDDPERGIISPAEFVPVLEEARLVHRLDLHILRLACENRRHGGDPAHEANLSLNLSRLDFELCDIVSEVEAVLDEYGISHDQLSVEITEDALTGNAEFLSDEIDRFRTDGIEVWMDDFGSGYSSLNLLKEYRFDVVKVDMGFLRGFERNDDARVLLANVINMAKELGLHTLVEGVETEEQLHFLKSVGCGRCQGYLFGKPRSYDQIQQAAREGTHLAVEPAERRAFYAAIGDVNLMRPDPLQAPDGSYVPGDAPAAVVMRESGVYRYLNVTDAFLTFLHNIGVADAADGAARLNHIGSDERGLLDDAIARCQQSGAWEWGAIDTGDLQCAVRVNLVASLPDQDALAATIIAMDLHEAPVAALA